MRNRGIIRRIWRKRKFLFLLRSLERRQAHFLGAADYGTARAQGMPKTPVLRFMIHNWSYISLVLILLGIKKPILPGSGSGNGLDHGQMNSALDLFGIEQTCKDEKLIELPSEGRIRITYNGERFVGPVVFYNALLEKYGYGISFLFGSGAAAIISALFWLFQWLNR